MLTRAFLWAWPLTVCGRIERGSSFLFKLRFTLVLGFPGGRVLRSLDLVRDSTQRVPAVLCIRHVDHL